MPFFKLSTLSFDMADNSCPHTLSPCGRQTWRGRLAASNILEVQRFWTSSLAWLGMPGLYFRPRCPNGLAPTRETAAAHGAHISQALLKTRRGEEDISWT